MYKPVITRSAENMRAIFALVFALIFIVGEAAADNRKLTLNGHIMESVWKADLPKAWIYTTDSDGNRVDSITLGSIGFLIFEGSGNEKPSVFAYDVERKDSTYVFEVGCEGYTTQTVVYKVENVGPRERSREIPPIYLDRAPIKLKDVEVTASKVAFYHKGDTVVYNADALQLAEGSMLDALIQQLPGVELKPGGRITVNGEYVKTLLLNGKELFDGNKQLMLNNIGAYTVKDIRVYEGHSLRDKLEGNLSGPKQLTMDVRLKKEYSIGWIANIQAGYGTEDRYLGRLFASWFSPTTDVVLVGNINNLNDNREPGKNDSWSPEQMPTGTKRYQLAGINYSHRPRSEKFYLSGNAMYQGDRLDSRTMTDRTNFFQTGNTYDYSFRNSRYKDMKLSAGHYTHVNFGGLGWSTGISGNYSRVKNHSSGLSAAFDSEQADITLSALEAIYSDGSDERLSSIINRVATLGDATVKTGTISGSTGVNYGIPHTSDVIAATFSAGYTTRKESLWDDYMINYGADPTAALRDRNYTDNSPNHDLTFGGNLRYSYNGDDIKLTTEYVYTYLNRVSDSYQYSLDRLGDMGIYGTLPSGYAATLDAGNSFRSDLYDNSHTLKLSFSYARKWGNGNNLRFVVNSDLGVSHSHLNYLSDGKTYPIRRTSFLANMPEGGEGVTLRYAIGNSQKRQTTHTLLMQYHLNMRAPELLHLVDVENSSDPMNISLGNPGLKNSVRHSFRWFYMVMPAGTGLRNFINVRYSREDNALVRGYYYDMSDGVRYNRTYNVDGNYTFNVSEEVSWQFGSRRQFKLSSATDGGRIHSVDMIGTGDSRPAPSAVNTRTLGENLQFTWKIGRQSLSAVGKVTNRHTTSSREGFAKIDATHLQYGVTGVFRLPAGFGISTDFTFYTRRGYGMRELDTTDAVWNLRATYTPRGGRWLFTVDGFDLLHRLSNIHYAVTASGRTITYTNTLPRYILATVQYRFSIQPRK